MIFKTDKFTHVVFQYPGRDNEKVPLPLAFAWHDQQCNEGVLWRVQRVVDKRGRCAWGKGFVLLDASAGRYYLACIGAGAYGDTLVAQRSLEEIRIGEQA